MDHTRRTALLSAAALCLVLGGLFWLAVREDTPVPAAAPAAVAASTDNWGLSFQTEGEPLWATPPPSPWPNTTPIMWGTRPRRSSTSPLTADMRTATPPRSWTC